MTITEYEQEMTHLMTDISEMAQSYSNTPLSALEEREYQEFAQTAMELVHEQNPPQGRPGSTTEIMDADHIREVLGRIKAYRLKRLFPLMAPERALRAAEYINRRGADKRFWIGEGKDRRVGR